MTGLRRRLSGYRQELRHALTPGLVDEILEARRFAKRSPGTRGGLRSYRLAKQARLDLIPPDIRLDGRLVVDLGANVGDWTTAARSSWLASPRPNA